MIDISQKLNGLVDNFADMKAQINSLRESMVRDVYSEYDPPRSYPDPIVQATRDLMESGLPFPPVGQHQEGD